MGGTDGQGVSDSPDGHASPASLRLTLVISSLEMGGAERVMTELANHWAGLGWAITLVNLNFPSDRPPAYPLDPAVTVVGLDLHRPSASPFSAIGNNWRRIRALRAAIAASHPQVAMSFMANSETLLAAARLGVPVIVSEHRGPRGELNLAWSILRELTYRRAAFVVMLTNSALAHLSPALQRRGRVIPNPLPGAFLAGPVGSSPAPGAPSGAPVIMGLGRLGPEKGFDVLIRAFARISPRWPRARLVIWGEGDERAALETLCRDEGVADRVALPGTTRTPEQELLAATLFVLSSYKEGLPMALIEAMALGRAVIASDCEHGPRDIIRDGIDGLLVTPGDVDALADAMDSLLGDEARREGLAERAVEVRERFSIETVSAKWEALFRQAVGRS